RTTVEVHVASQVGMLAESGRGLIIAVNKCDGIPPDKRDQIRVGLDLRLRFLDFAPLFFISALHGTGVGELISAVGRVYDAAMRELPTAVLTLVVEYAVQRTSHALGRGRPIHVRY